MLTELKRRIKLQIQEQLYLDVLKKMGIPKAIASDDGGEFKGRFEQILDAERLRD
jgi:hypothetical protein